MDKDEKTTKGARGEAKIKEQDARRELAIKQQALEERHKQEQLEAGIDRRIRKVVYIDRHGEENERVCQSFSVVVAGPDALTIMWLGDIVEINQKETRREIIGHTCGIKEYDVFTSDELWEDHIKKI